MALVVISIRGLFRGENDPALKLEDGMVFGESKPKQAKAQQPVEEMWEMARAMTRASGGKVSA